MRLILFAFAMLFHHASHSQINPRKLDSLMRSHDSVLKSTRSYQDSFVRMQDSMQHAHIIDTAIKGQSTPGNNKKDKEQIPAYVLIIAAVLTILLTAIILKRKRKDISS